MYGGNELICGLNIMKSIKVDNRWVFFSFDFILIFLLVWLDFFVLVEIRYGGLL